ncbi:MAG: Maf family protein [Oscillospiraceae bacterium]|jgi:septum formation protein|nr:Maf family protein [Oscillospiraceae bacterium]
MKYILASGSPRRKELLALVGLPFGVCVPKVAEIIAPDCPPEQCAEDLAAQKAAYVARQFPDDCVIGADTVVVAGGEILGKPKDAADAERMLRLLSGREHVVITGVCLRLGERERRFSQHTLVRFYALGGEEIEAYVRTGEPMDKAGAYGIQGRGALLAEGITGDYFNVVGLPVALLARELRQFIRKE